MKNIPTPLGPFRERPYFTDEELEGMCVEELNAVDLLPDRPSEIRVDRFIEKRFGVTPEYEDLGRGVLGLTQFGPNGVTKVSISRVLDEQRTVVAERQIRSTLAHEAGHGLLHGPLLATGEQTFLFGDGPDSSPPKVLCRDRSIGIATRAYNGEWWEFQANRIMGGLLMPKPLVLDTLRKLRTTGMLGAIQVDPFRDEEVVSMLSVVFNVNPMAARVRLAVLFPTSGSGQMTM